MDEAANPGIMANMVLTPGGRADDEGFESLFLAQFPALARTVHYVVQDRQLAEEITQDAFIRLLQHWPRISHYDRPDLWVRRVAIRQAQRERRREWRRPDLERRVAYLAPVGEPESPDTEVLAAVRGLAPKQRAVVVPFYFEDRPMDEIAEIIGCSVSTGWSQLHSARKRLASVLSEEVSDDVR